MKTYMLVGTRSSAMDCFMVMRSLYTKLASAANSACMYVTDLSNVTYYSSCHTPAEHGLRPACQLEMYACDVQRPVT